MSDALTTEIRDSKEQPLGEVVVNDQTFSIVEKPDTLMLAELARTGSGDPEALGVLAEFFEMTLGRENYVQFKKAVRAVKLDDQALMAVLRDILEQAMGRPTR